MIPLAEALVSLVEHDLPTTWGGPDLPARVDSWLEHRFAWHAIKYLRPEIRLRPQVSYGRYRVDFLTDGYRVNLGFECDGAAYHTSPESDHIRDSWLLTQPDIWGIYRLPYHDLVEWPEWCFLAIAQRHYDLFTTRALENLQTLTRRHGDVRLRVSYRCKASS